METVGALLADPADLIAQINEKIEVEKRIARDPSAEIAALGRRLEDLVTKRSRYVDLFAEGHITAKEELAQKLTQVDEERESLEKAIAGARDRSKNIKLLTYQKAALLFLYSHFASHALESFSPEHRREMYERIGLRVRAYRDREPEIELTFDPRVLPSTAEAEAVLYEATHRMTPRPSKSCTASS